MSRAFASRSPDFADIEKKFLKAFDLQLADDDVVQTNPAGATG